MPLYRFTPRHDYFLLITPLLRLDTLAAAMPPSLFRLRCSFRRR